MKQLHIAIDTDDQAEAERALNDLCTRLYQGHGSGFIYRAWVAETTLAKPAVQGESVV